MSSLNAATDGLFPAMNFDMRQTSRYITTHNDAGQSIFKASPQLLYRDRGGYTITRNYAVTKVPTPLTNDQDIKDYVVEDSSSASSFIHGGSRVTVPGGLNFLTVDLGPNARTPMHRTVSIDFIVVTEGIVVLELDSGEKKTLYSGDTIVQRATMHRWINPSADKPARFAAVVAASEQQEIAGKLLEQEYLNDSAK